MRLIRKRGPGPRAKRHRMIREHASWLSKALRGPSRYPEIPTRPVRDGGFAGLMAHPAGRGLAEQWWDSALETMDGQAG